MFADSLCMYAFNSDKVQQSRISWPEMEGRFRSTNLMLNNVIWKWHTFNFIAFFAFPIFFFKEMEKSENSEYEIILKETKKLIEVLRPDMVSQEARFVQCNSYTSFFLSNLPCEP